MLVRNFLINNIQKLNNCNYGPLNIVKNDAYSTANCLIKSNNMLLNKFTYNTVVLKSNAALILKNIMQHTAILNLSNKIAVNSKQDRVSGYKLVNILNSQFASGGWWIGGATLLKLIFAYLSSDGG